jgi:hypothetical protein
VRCRKSLQQVFVVTRNVIALSRGQARHAGGVKRIELGAKRANPINSLLRLATGGTGVMTHRRVAVLL